eukprot:CAMPEP_0115762362 /NCGR_PEP_ID=MMETSP0272-20121206/100989_1 /TAXON_ID=71861 /ORGANISM="Scrippsiella trochoidea, Strain CCMP3099" /LENGTH=81 /DNA_ID=CAMNT_0003208083 /DNA_START=364 /DNA_END=605 /DNA_ORIENTATION=-
MSSGKSPNQPLSLRKSSAQQQHGKLDPMAGPRVGLPFAPQHSKMPWPVQTAAPALRGHTLIPFALRTSDRGWLSRDAANLR